MTVRCQIRTHEIQHHAAGHEATSDGRRENDLERPIINPSHASCRAGENRQDARGADRAAHLPGKACPVWKEISLCLKLQPVFVADQDDRSLLKRCGHADLPGAPERS